MKVAHFLPHYPGREGTTSFCRALCSSLNTAEPASSSIISFKTDKNANGDEVLTYPNSSRNPFCIPQKLKEDLLEGSLNLDGMVLHGAFNPRMAAMGKVLRKARLPYIFMPHDPYVPELMHSGWLKKWCYWKLYEKPLMDAARGIILLSSSHEASLMNRGYLGDIAVVANGCDHTVSVPERKKRAGDVKRIQYLGRMDQNHKGLDLLIKAFAGFSRDKRGQVELWLSGNDWKDRGALEKLSEKMEMTDCIRFTGPRAESSQEVFVEADLAILPSRFDGFGLTIVEAMQSACPVIATKSCGVAEHVKECEGGWVCDASVVGLQDALEMAWKARGGWSLMGGKAKNYVVEQLTWDQTAAKSRAVYDDWFQ